MGEVFGLAAIIVCLATIAWYVLLPVSPNSAFPLSLLILMTYLLAAWAHVACGSERAKEREKSRANFEIEIHLVAFPGTIPPSLTMRIAVDMTIHNRGADSAPRSWSPVVEFMDGHRNFFAEAALDHSPTGLNGTGENWILNSTTIPRNGRKRGWLMFSAQCSHPYDPRRDPRGGLNEIKKITIYVSDYTGGTYEHLVYANSSDPVSMARLFETRRTVGT
jgi:hypothetical protein